MILLHWCLVWVLVKQMAVESHCGLILSNNHQARPESFVLASSWRYSEERRVTHSMSSFFWSSAVLKDENTFIKVHQTVWMTKQEPEEVNIPYLVNPLLCFGTRGSFVGCSGLHLQTPKFPLFPLASPSPEIWDTRVKVVSVCPWVKSQG